MKKQVHIDITAEGEIKITTEGFKGKSCVEETAFLEELLGKRAITGLTPAYYVKEKVEIKQHLPLCG